MKKNGILGAKLFDGKTVENLNKEVYEDYELAKDNIQTLLEFAMKAMNEDSNNVLLVLPNAKALIDTALKNSANISQLISINTKVAGNEKEESDEESMASIRKVMQSQLSVNKTIATA
jgi:hypothetical protein